MNETRALSFVAAFCLLAVIVLQTTEGGSWPGLQGPALEDERLHIQLVADSATTDKAIIEIVGLNPEALANLRAENLSSKQWAELFTVYTAQPDKANRAGIPPLLGNYAVAHDRIRFTPRFPLLPGMIYFARFNAALFGSNYGRENGESERFESGNWLLAQLSLPEEAMTASSYVEHVYPSSSKIPVNQLKFYVHFSAPMSFGEAYERIHLYDNAGNEVKDAFLVLEQELWDQERVRLTLLLDPGRIKSGLRPNLEQGLPLVEGQSYTLAIDSQWPDATGKPLKAKFRKEFSTVEADRSPPNYEDWRVIPPASATVQPLRLVFPEPLDHALLERLLQVRNRFENEVSGTIEILDEERQWLFTPRRPWVKGRYSLHVNTILEDLAGNNLRKPFDLDLQQNMAGPAHDYVTLRFEVP